MMRTRNKLGVSTRIADAEEAFAESPRLRCQSGLRFSGEVVSIDIASFSEFGRIGFPRDKHSAKPALSAADSPARFLTRTSVKNVTENGLSQTSTTSWVMRFGNPNRIILDQSPMD